MRNPSILEDHKQEEAINVRNTNLIVSASAGAGKTRVLINRLTKRIIHDKLNMNEICALTFTDAAAGEMKNRLLQSLNDTLKDETLSEDDRNHLLTQLPLVETAHISTIHSFCLTIIKNHGYVLGLDPSRTENIIDPSMVALYKSKALKKSIHNWLENRPDDFNTLFDVFVDRPTYTKGFEQEISKTAAFLITKPHLDQAIHEILALYDVDTLEAFPQNLLDELFFHYEKKLSISHDALETYLLESYEGYVEKNPEEYRMMNNLLLDISGLLDKIKKKDLSFYDNIINTLNVVIKYRPEKEILHLRKNYIDSVKDVIKLYIPKKEIFETQKEHKEIISLLIDLSKDYMKAYANIKEALGGLDYDDFEHFALKILEHQQGNKKGGYIAESMRRQFKEIMVDEFQDTNDFQDQIIQLISDGSNIFRVGDIKQSIYRFRNAKPQIMKDLMKDDTIHKVPFIHNYRSKDSIVKYNNDLFRELMNGFVSDTYTHHDEVRVNLHNQLKDNVPVELRIMTNQEDKSDKLSVDERRTVLAQFIANQVIALNRDENVDFKDITILSNVYDRKSYLIKAFEDANIPFYIDDRTGYYKIEIVDQTLDWLRYITTGHDYYLVSVLTSPFVAVSEDTLANIKIKHRKLSLKQGYQIEFKDDYNKLHGTIQKATSMDVVSVLKMIYNFNDTYHHKLSLQSKTNLDLLLEKAIVYQGSNNPTLFGFIQFVDALDDSKNSQSVALNKNENVVKAVTIHQSKGLQYPNLIIWPFGKLNLEDLSKPIVTDDLFGITLKDTNPKTHLPRKSILRLVSEMRQTKEAIEEYLRLLYVATTRAEDRLILMDFIPDTRESLEASLFEDITYNTYYNFTSSTELIFPIQSKYATLIESDYTNFKPEALPKLSKKKINPFVMKLNAPIQEPTETAPTYEFKFDKNFIHSVGYGTTIHNEIDKLPPKTWTDTDLKHVSPQFKVPLQAYNTHPFTQELYDYEIIESEMPILYLKDGKPVQGIVDFYAIKDDKLVIVDFKTDVAQEEALIERYLDQLTTYKKALGTKFPELECTSYIYSFYLKKYIRV